MKLRAFILAAAAPLLITTVTYAGLGGSVASIQQDAQASSPGAPTAPITKSHHAVYDQYEFAPNGLRLHEFAGNGGAIFALAWAGRHHPDLRALLGPHFQDFQAALRRARQEHRRGGAIVVDTPGFHLEIGGHMGALYGRVWLKNQLPGGMDLNEIR